MPEQAALVSDGDPGTTIGSILRDSNYWFSDGNIAIVAKNHNAGARPTAFRVHRSILFRHSAALSDLLGEALPQPTTTATV